MKFPFLKKTNKKEEEDNIMELILILASITGIVVGILLNKNKHPFPSSEEQTDSLKTAAKKQIDYNKLIEEKEREIYPKLLSFYLYLKSNIKDLPPHLVSVLEEKYGLSRIEPILDWGEYKWDPNLRKHLKHRIDEEPEIKEKLTLTGSYLSDYYNFLRKKAQIEAEDIVNKLLEEEKTGGKNEE